MTENLKLIFFKKLPTTKLSASKKPSQFVQSPVKCIPRYSTSLDEHLVCVWLEPRDFGVALSGTQSYLKINPMFENHRSSNRPQWDQNNTVGTARACSTCVTQRELPEAPFVSRGLSQWCTISRTWMLMLRTQEVHSWAPLGLLAKSKL